METKHTLGPWYTVAKNNNYQSIVCQELTGNTIAVTYTGDDNDARLIAAAPDLLAALEKLVKAIDPEATKEIGLGVYLQARAAIAKAKG